MFLGLCASIGWAGVVHAQGLVTSNVTWSGTVSFVTSNNVTSAKFSWLLDGSKCEDLAGSGPLVRYGSSFWYDFDLTVTFGISCPNVLATITTTVPLGTLAPGVYTLITTSWGAPVATNTFLMAPVLQSHGFDTNGCFRVQMSSGVTNVNYVLQRSTDLLNWTSLSTNTVSTNAVGVVLTDSCPALPGNRFYRVRCQ